ncbi:outer membrane beta-barrel protein [Sphingobium quisquiliarum]|nr:outer membrane beta-barrel protein [Sphingobium quisquiliarum]
MKARSTARAAIAIAVAGGLPAVAAHAQDLRSGKTFLDVPEAVFVPTPLRLGSATATIGIDGKLEYDSNIYAQPSGEKDDFKLLVSPYVEVVKPGSRLQLSARAAGSVRRYFKYERENAEAGEVALGAVWTPSAADKLTANASWSHVIEDRGEPEGRTVTSIGPRKLNVLDGDLSYSRQGARLGFMVRGSASRFRYTSDFDEDRDIDNYALLGRVLVRAAPLLNGFVEGFVSKRDYRITPPGFPNRDSTTYGGRVGVSIDPGGTVRGEAAVGLYHFNPKDPLIEARTRLSAQASLTYSPQPRTAITLDGFIGNVATYRTGAQSREDMRFRLGVQQEIRHNLRGEAGLVYRRSKFFGAGDVQKIYGVTGDLEYSLNRRVAIGADVRYSKRTSSDPFDEFERVRAGLTLRLHY